MSEHLGAMIYKKKLLIDKAHHRQARQRPGCVDGDGRISANICKLKSFRNPTTQIGEEVSQALAWRQNDMLAQGEKKKTEN